MSFFRSSREKTSWVKRSWMMLAIDPSHGREDDSRNGPDCGKRPAKSLDSKDAEITEPDNPG